MRSEDYFLIKESMLKDTREGVKWKTNLIQLKELFHLKDQDLRSYSPLTLAYIGDGVYELIIRTILVKKGQLSGAIVFIRKQAVW